MYHFVLHKRLWLCELHILENKILSSLEYNIGAVCENDIVLGEFSFAVL